MSRRTVAEILPKVNIAIISICLVFFVICVFRQLWFPALLNGVLVVSNAVQLATRRRPDAP